MLVFYLSYQLANSGQRNFFTRKLEKIVTVLVETLLLQAVLRKFKTIMHATKIIHKP